jgi:hypothetical protein
MNATELTTEQLHEVFAAAKLLVASYCGLTASEINNSATAKYPERHKIASERTFDESTDRIWAVINAS